MTSKVSFRKLMSEIFIHRVWIVLLISAVAALAYPIALQTALHEGVEMEMGREYLESYAMDILGIRVRYTYILMCIAAVISAASCFSYLNSKEKTDFYHSLAVKRQKIYVARWLSGILLSVIPYMAAMLVSIFVVLPINGLLTGELAGDLIGTMFFFVFVCSAVYAMCVLAMTFSGRILTGLFLMVVFIGYMPYVYYLLRNIFAYFYPYLDITSFSFSNMGWGFYTSFSFSNMGWGFYTSPLSSSLGIACDVGNTVACWVLIAVFLVGGFLAGMYVHKIRASETAGQSMTFPVLKSIMKILVGVMVALVAGYIGVLLQGDTSIAAFIIWALVAAFLLNLLIEFFYGTDFKSIFKKWKSAVIMFGVIVASIVIIAGDPAGINKWKPETDEVKKMSFHTDFQIGGFGEFYCNEVVSKDTRLEDGLIEDFKPIYEVADPGLVTEEFNRYGVITTYFEYELQNGKKVRRVYGMSGNALMDMIKKLSNSYEFREKYYPTWIADLDSFKNVEVSNASFLGGWSDKRYSIPKNRLSELVQTLKEDSIQLGIDEMSKSSVVALIDFSENGKNMQAGSDIRYSSNSYGGEEQCTVNIYPQYKKTILLLREITGDASIGKKVDLADEAENIKKLTVYDEYDEYEVDIIDKKDITMIMESIKEVDIGFIREDIDNIMMDITYSDDTENHINFNITDKKKFDGVMKKYER